MVVLRRRRRSQFRVYGRNRVEFTTRICFPAVLDASQSGWGVFDEAAATAGGVPMKAQFGNKQLINQPTGKQNGLGVVAAEGYRVVSVVDRPASECLSPDCRSGGRSMRSLRPESRDRLCQSVASTWRSCSKRAVTTIDPGVTSVTAITPSDCCRLPAPAWAAFVLNHALCG